MKSKNPSHISQKLTERKKNNALRELSCKAYSVDFYSNDYIGFSRSEQLKSDTQKILNQYSVQNGATGSRLISGNFPLLNETENYISNFHKSESALLFTSGYTANIGFFSCVPQRGDVVLYDEFIHASIRDGFLLGHAKTYKFVHNNCDNLEEQLIRHQKEGKNIFVVTESVFSMDGDIPDLCKLTEITEKYNAFLIVDEAHALGVIGKKGQGLVSELGLEERVFARIVTFGKALGSHGACVLTSKEVKDYLINFARSFIYTTGLSPHSVAQILAGYQMLASTKEIEKLCQNIAFFQELCKEIEWKQTFTASNSPIQSILIGGNTETKKVALALQKVGFGVKPILSPTVPQGKERVRICLHSFNTKEEMRALVEMMI